MIWCFHRNSLKVLQVVANDDGNDSIGDDFDSEIPRVLERAAFHFCQCFAISIHLDSIRGGFFHRKNICSLSQFSLHLFKPWMADSTEFRMQSFSTFPHIFGISMLRTLFQSINYLYWECTLNIPPESTQTHSYNVRQHEKIVS